MKKLLIGLLAILFIAWSVPAFAQDYVKPRANNFGYVGDSSHYYADGYFQEMHISSMAIFPEISAPSGDPAANYGWLYSKDNGAAETHLYWECSSGAVTDLTTAASPKWDDVADPDANSSITLSTYTNVFTGAAVAAHQNQFINTGNMGDFAIVSITQETGTPTDGKLLYGTMASTLVDGIQIYNSTADITSTNTLLRLDFKDDGDTDGYYVVCRDNSSADSQFSIRMDGSVVLGGITGSGALAIYSPTGTALTLAAEDGSVAAEDVIVIGNNFTVDATGNTVLGASSVGTLGCGAVTTTGTLTFSGADDAITSTNWSINNAGNISTAGTFTFSGADDAIAATNWSVTNAGAATFVSMSANNIYQDAFTAKTAGGNLTLDGNGAGGIIIGGTSTGQITISGAAAGATAVVFNTQIDTITVNDGKIAITDDQAGPTLAITNNSLTNTNLITLSATALTSAKGISLVATGMTTGTALYLHATEATLTTGKYIECFDNAANDFSVAKYGATVIAGNASGTDALTLTNGDILVTAGHIDITTGNFTVGTGNISAGTGNVAITTSGNFTTASGYFDSNAGAYIQLDSITNTKSSIKRNIDTTDGPLLTLENTNIGDDRAVLAVSQKSTGGIDAVDIESDSTAIALHITTSVATAEDVWVTCAGSKTASAVTVDLGAWLGTAGVGAFDISSTAAVTIPAGEMMEINQAGTGQHANAIVGSCLTIIEAAQDPAAAGINSFAVSINSSNDVGALKVVKGLSYFDANVQMDSDLAINLSANTEEVLITPDVTDYAAGSGVLTMYDTAAAGQTNASYLLRLAREANGDDQNHFLLCEDNSTGAAGNGDDMFYINDEGTVYAAGVITSAVGVSPGPTATSQFRSVTVTVAAADVLLLQSAPYTLIAAPGAGYMIEVLQVIVVLDSDGTAFIVAADEDLMIEYTSGQNITASIETAGLLDQVGDRIAIATPADIAGLAAASIDGDAVRLFNTGAGEIAGGGASEVDVKITYMLHATGL